MGYKDAPVVERLFAVVPTINILVATQSILDPTLEITIEFGKKLARVL